MKYADSHLILSASSKLVSAFRFSESGSYLVRAMEILQKA
jgi:hypothetical protein